MVRAAPLDTTAVMYKSNNPLIDSPEKALKSSAMWGQIQRQFTIAEQKIFVEHWTALINQFKGDVIHAELMQVTELIKLELLANRVLEDQQGCKESVDRSERLIQDEMDRPEKERDKRLLEGLYSSMDANRMAGISLKKSYLELVEKKDKALTSLKATRQQRYQAIENTKTSILDWFKIVASDREVRKRIGIEAEKLHIAIEQERDRLTQYVTFADGELDKPILNSKSVELSDSN